MLRGNLTRFGDIGFQVVELWLELDRVRFFRRRLHVIGRNAFNPFVAAFADGEIAIGAVDDHIGA